MIKFGLESGITYFRLIGWYRHSYLLAFMIYIVVNVLQIQRNNVKASYCRMSGFGENEDTELGRDGYDWKCIEENC
jgi:hypothetical protein